MKTTQRNARFWQWINGGYVKITLRPNQELSWGVSCRHDEGWSSEGHTWEFDGDKVYESISNDGTDCDGRMSSESRWEWNTTMLGKPYDENSPATPAWVKCYSRQRDYSAEAMGY